MFPDIRYEKGVFNSDGRIRDDGNGRLRRKG